MTKATDAGLSAILSSPTPARGPNARLIVVDDHPIARDGVRRITAEDGSLTVCAGMALGPDSLKIIADLKPDMLITEIVAQRADGIQFVRQLRRFQPKLPVLVLSALDEMLYAERLLSEGAHGYIMKAANACDLIEAIRRVNAGKTYVSAQVSESIIRRTAGTRARPIKPMDRLSTRELQVVQMIGRGVSTREIAGLLCLSIKTIESHRQRIKQKLNLKTGIQLMQFSMSETTKIPHELAVPYVPVSSHCSAVETLV